MNKTKLAFSIFLIFISLMASTVIYDIKLDKKDQAILEYNREINNLKDDIYVINILDINNGIIDTTHEYSLLLLSERTDTWSNDIDSQIQILESLVQEVKSIEPSHNHKGVHQAYINSLCELEYAFVSIKSSVEERDTEQLNLAIQSMDESIMNLTHIINLLRAEPYVSMVSK